MHEIFPTRRWESHEHRGRCGAAVLLPSRHDSPEPRTLRRRRHVRGARHTALSASRKKFHLLYEVRVTGVSTTREDRTVHGTTRLEPTQKAHVSPPCSTPPWGHESPHRAVLVQCMCSPLTVYGWCWSGTLVPRSTQQQKISATNESKTTILFILICSIYSIILPRWVEIQPQSRAAKQRFVLVYGCTCTSVYYSR